MSELFGVDFLPEEITIDETGKVIISNPKVAEAVKSAVSTRRRRPVININCPCNPI
ncbi:hypothetical protein [Neobacillus sp. LXY-4]|uniref:hypothetical protein n=1 Tax=Neobacillus sp. LXY-4 TaxID=3379826 RepID=UPI003EE2B446